ncbi:MAG: hypothetical protein J6Q02_10960 [Lachnospiraceae bacterium]|nr:hypothetical protein [Lachnospiraceae bacterium]
MAKLYWTKDIEKLFEDKLTERVMSAVNDSNMPLTGVTAEIGEVRCLRYFLEQIIADMKEMDRKDDAEMEEWRAKKNAEADAQHAGG